MQNANRSASEYARHVAARTLAVYHQSNPAGKEGGASKTFASSMVGYRAAGQQGYTRQAIEVPACCGCTQPDPVTNFVVGGDQSPCPPPYDSFAYYFLLSWNPVPGATSYTVTSSNQEDLVVSTGTTSATLYTPEDNSSRTLTLTAITPCGNSTTTGTAFAPCFLAGSLVTMADGTTKPIETVEVGDRVLGAFGEHNEVLALHRPLLGSHTMCKINEEHSTTSHHPHISSDRKFYCVHPETVLKATYGREHPVLNKEGVVEQRFLHGLAAGRIQKLDLGVELKTVEGSRPVRSLELYSLPEDTQLYNLVVSGSHTYHVDSYAVTGWPREDDFDYDAWA
jgi:hypothetical protein